MFGFINECRLENTPLEQIRKEAEKLLTDILRSGVLTEKEGHEKMEAMGLEPHDLSRVRRTLIPAELCFHVDYYSTSPGKMQDREVCIFPAKVCRKNSEDCGARENYFEAFPYFLKICRRIRTAHTLSTISAVHWAYASP